MADWLPGISQLKSGFQLICGDKEGAKKTQINFSKQCPGVSQARSLVEFASGDSEAARQTQWEFLGTVNGVANSIPGVGHVKSVVHYVAGDKDGGDNAMKASSRTIGVLAGGAGGFVVGGPPGAVAGGMYGGLVMDGVTTIVDSEVHGHPRPAGYFRQIGDIIKDPKDPGKWVDVGCSMVGDGMTGFAAGQAVQNMTKVKTQDGAKNTVKVQLKKKTMREKITSTKTMEKKITVTETVKKGHLEKTKSVVLECKTTQKFETLAEGMDKSLTVGAGIGAVGVCVSGVVAKRQTGVHNVHTSYYERTHDDDDDDVNDTDTKKMSVKKQMLE